MNNISPASDERAERPGSLRLSAILSHLTDENSAAPREPGGSPRATITIGEIVDRTTHAGFGFLNGFLALVAVPFIGLSTPFGLAIAFVAGQMIAGLDRPWLPQFIRRRTFPTRTIEWLSRRLVRATRGLEKIIRPRFVLLTRGPFWTLCGMGILLQGLGLALPLPIPLSNWPFIIVIVLYSIGLLENDGLLILVCHTATFLTIVAGVLFWDVIHAALHKAVQWFHGGPPAATQPVEHAAALVGHFVNAAFGSC